MALMDIGARIRQLEELIMEAKSMPLSASVLVNREELLELAQGMRDNLPEEVKQARWIVKDREELLAKARRDAESLVGDARQEQARLVAQEEVVRQSVAEAERILEEAREQARQIKLEAEDYVDAKLASFEVVITKTLEQLERTLEQVERGRERLRASIAQEELSVEEGEEPEAY